jgi:hypothetical protein
MVAVRATPKIPWQQLKCPAQLASHESAQQRDTSEVGQSIEIAPPREADGKVPVVLSRTNEQSVICALMTADPMVRAPPPPRGLVQSLKRHFVIYRGFHAGAE